MTKAMRALLIWFAAAAGLPALAADMPSGPSLPILGPTNEFTVHDGAWYLYRRLCSGCHGVTGQGIKPIGGQLQGNAFLVNARPADVIAVIRNGRKDHTKRYPQYIRGGPDGMMNMPPFDRLSLSDAEADILVAYLKGPFQQGKFNNP